MVAAGTDKSRHGGVRQQQRQDGKRRQAQTPLSPEPARILVGMSGEIDINMHRYETKAPTTPAILHFGILSAPAPNCEAPTNSRTPAPVSAARAGAAPRASASPARKICPMVE